MKNIFNYISRDTVEIRNPFRVGSLPLILKLYASIFSPTARKNRLKLYTYKNLMQILHKLKCSCHGDFSYAYKEDCIRKIYFPIQNTQFHSIYFQEYQKSYEAETAVLIDYLIDECQVFYDIGSNWGHYALYIASNKNFNGSVHAFEPFPASYADLCSVITQAKLEEIIYTHNLALSNNNEVSFMHFPDGIHSGLATVSNRGKVSITTKMLDDLTIDKPTFLKVDVEGHEAKVFEGALGNLNSSKPFIIFESWKDLYNINATLEPFKILDSAGYIFFIPSLTCEFNGIKFNAGYGDYSTKIASKAHVNLTHLNFEDRFLFKSQINVFACHKEKLNLIENKFERRL